MSTSIVQFRIDDDLKTQATEIYEELGLDLSTALRIFLKRSVSVRGLPFSMTLDKKAEITEYAPDSEADSISEMLMQRNDAVYKELAK